MTGRESTTDVVEWVRRETEHIDVVASWESLCDTYDALRFSDPLADAERLEEFKWIVQQMNAFLTKIRKRLLRCDGAEAMASVLGSTMVPMGQMELKTRRALVYQKLRQQWVRTMAMRLQAIAQEDAEKENGETDGWSDRDDDW